LGIVGSVESVGAEVLEFIPCGTQRRGQFCLHLKAAMVGGNPHALRAWRRRRC
jgi:hypothetical protein